MNQNNIDLINIKKQTSLYFPHFENQHDDRISSAVGRFRKSKLNMSVSRLLSSLEISLGSLSSAFITFEYMFFSLRPLNGKLPAIMR